jgi:hypothetical protein
MEGTAAEERGGSDGGNELTKALCNSRIVSIEGSLICVGYVLAYTYKYRRCVLRAFV